MNNTSGVILEPNANDQHHQQQQDHITSGDLQQQQHQQALMLHHHQQQQLRNAGYGSDHSTSSCHSTTAPTTAELKDAQMVAAVLTGSLPPNGVIRTDTTLTMPLESVYAHLSADGTGTVGITGTGAVQGTQVQVPSSMFHGTWPFVGAGIPLHPRHLKGGAPGSGDIQQQDTASVMSFNSSACSAARRTPLNNQLGTKVSFWTYSHMYIICHFMCSCEWI